MIQKTKPTPPSFRIGIGVDHHRLTTQPTSSPLILGGFLIPQTNLFLIAKSDGDVIIHALCNALSTALGGGSFSTIADQLCQKKITNSAVYLNHFLNQLQQQHYQINNLSISIEAGQPKLEPFRTEITRCLAELTGLIESQIGIAFTTGEGLTACGKGEGISAQVICLLSKNT